MNRISILIITTVILFSVLGCAPSLPMGTSSASMDRNGSSVAMEAPAADSSTASQSSALYASANEEAELMDSDRMDDASSDGANVTETRADSDIGPTSLGERKIIREANMRIEADNLTDALNWATALSVRTGGYTVHTNSWLVNEQQHASFSFAVPVERFEEALEQTRSLGTVLGESVSSRDVTAHYVDIESRIKNLEMTTERVRSFLAEAKTVKQTLEVNRELTRLEGDLNSLKGQRNVLARQTTFSTIHLELMPIPVPPTTAEVVETVKVWTPIETFNRALAALLSGLQIVGNAIIWLAVVGGPLLLLLMLLGAILRRFLPIRHREAATSQR